jgi:hypothetical protein
MGLRYMGRGSLSRAHQYGKDAAGDKEHDGRGEEEFEGVDRPPGTEDEWLPCVDVARAKNSGKARLQWKRLALERPGSQIPRTQAKRDAVTGLPPKGRPHETERLSTPSSHPSIVVRNPRSTPYQDRSHQVYPEPQVEPLMRMNQYQDQHPWKTSPQHSSPGLRDKEPPHVDPSDKQGKPGQKQT